MNLYIESGIAALERAANSHCRRCAGNEFAPPECDACRHEVERNRQDARDELIEFIRTDDGTDSGRPAHGAVDANWWW